MTACSQALLGIRRCFVFSSNRESLMDSSTSCRNWPTTQAMRFAVSGCVDRCAMLTVAVPTVTCSQDRSVVLGKWGPASASHWSWDRCWTAPLVAEIDALHEQCNLHVSAFAKNDTLTGQMNQAQPGVRNCLNFLLKRNSLSDNSTSCQNWATAWTIDKDKHSTQLWSAAAWKHK